MLILNDVHLGVNRSGGTTPASREALRNYLFSSFEGILNDTTESHVCILGDLFDQFEVDGRDWVQCYMILQGWLGRLPGKSQSLRELTKNDVHRLTLVAGNHDHSPKALRVSSFEMLCAVLIEQFGHDRVNTLGIDQWTRLSHSTDKADVFDIVALAHCSNQEVFNAKLTEILEKTVTGDRILLHANYDNNFAAQSDHSLNVTREQAKAFASKGATLCFAHEHQAREALGGSVVVFGNQWPSSVADCLGNTSKAAHIMSGSVTKVGTWSMEDEEGYAEVDWRELHSPELCTGFIKVVGTASANEAGDCINAISKFRSRSPAYVITNGVHIEGVAENEDLPEAFECSRAFDVLEFIYSNLDEAQTVAVKKLMGACEGKS